MSDRPPSLSTVYYDPEAIPVPEPEPTPDPPKRRGRPPGSKNAPKPEAVKRSIPWFSIWRAAFWGVVAVIGVVTLYWGVQGWLGQSIAYLALAVSVPLSALLLDRDWKKMRGSG
jgi:hypothetical protein